MPIQGIDSLIKRVVLFSRRHSYHISIFLSWGKSKYFFDDHSESHSGYINIAINAIDIIPAEISTSVPTRIYISTDDYSLEYLDPVNSLDYFVIKNPYPYFNRDKPLA